MPSIRRCLAENVLNMGRCNLRHRLSLERDELPYYKAGNDPWAVPVLHPCSRTLLPIPPLDGGRFVVEIFQKGTRKTVSQKAMNYMSLAGMARPAAPAAPMREWS